MLKVDTTQPKALEDGKPSKAAIPRKCASFDVDLRQVFTVATRPAWSLKLLKLFHPKNHVICPPLTPVQDQMARLLALKNGSCATLDGNYSEIRNDLELRLQRSRRRSTFQGVASQPLCALPHGSRCTQWLKSRLQCLAHFRKRHCKV